MLKKFRIIPADPPNEGITFVDHSKTGRSGHLGHPCKPRGLADFLILPRVSPGACSKAAGDLLFPSLARVL